MRSVLTLLLTCILSFTATSVSAQDVTTVYLIRHAEKKLETDQDPELTEPGRARAQLWATVFSKSELDAVYSTDTKRTRDTAAPIAESQRKPVLLYDTQVLSRDSLLSKHHGHEIVIVGHSNTLPGLVNKFIQEDRYTDLDESQYSYLFTVTMTDESASATVLVVDPAH